MKHPTQGRSVRPWQIFETSLASEVIQHYDATIEWEFHFSSRDQTCRLLQTPELQESGIWISALGVTCT